MGDDLVVTIGGADRPHVVCVVLAEPRPSRRRPDGITASCSTLTIPPHKEEPIARVVATALCEASNRVVVATAGLHEDMLDEQGVECYLRLRHDRARAVVETGVWRVGT
jgi:hypothetical protein